MLKPRDLRIGGKLVHVCTQVRHCDRPAEVFRLLLEELRRDHRRLGIFFSALAVMLQIPGGAEHEYAVLADLDTEELLRECDDRTALDILAVCLDRLGGKHVMRQIPRGREHEPRPLPEALQARVDGLDRKALLNVAAECIDGLMVYPEMEVVDEEEQALGEPDEEDRNRRRWWARLWPGR